MRRLSGLLVAGVLALAGCSGDSGTPAAGPSERPAESPQATAPTEALAPAPSVGSRTDARVLLGPRGDLELLPGKVEVDLAALDSLRVTHVLGRDLVRFVAEPERIGTGWAGGERAVHFRKTWKGVTVDSWIAADVDGVTTRLLRVVTRGDGPRTVLRLSQHGSAAPVAPAPPADEVVHPGEV